MKREETGNILTCNVKRNFVLLLFGTLWKAFFWAIKVRVVPVFIVCMYIDNVCFKERKKVDTLE